MGSLIPATADPLAAMSEVQLILHAPPDFPSFTEILGVCGVADKYATSDKYAWMVADFLAFKVGCYRLGRRPDHTWLSSIDLEPFLANVSTKLDTGPGSPMREMIFGPKENHITKIPDNNAGFLNALLTQIGDSAKSAVEKKIPLVIFMFTPVTPEHDICVDFGEKKFLTTEEIRRTIEEATGRSDLPVTLLTPSAFTGGWNCRPNLMGPARCTEDKAMEMIARSAGGAFADTFMKIFTSRQSPLLAAEHQDAAKYDDLMPLSPTVEQKNFLYHLQGRIHTILEHRFSPFAQRHTVVVDGPDPWEILAPRRGLALKDWGPRFSDRPPYDAVRRVDFFGEAFGGERSSQYFHLCYLIDIELNTCPGDWNKKTAGMTQELFRGFTEHPNPDDDHFKQVFDALDYRASSMKLAHCIAKALHLPMPGNLKCRYWNDGYDQDDAFYKRHAAAFGEAHNLFDHVAVRPRERRHDYKVVRFLRASRWLSACIAMKFAHDGPYTANVKEFVNDSVTSFITKVKDLQLDLLLQDKEVPKASSRWLAAIGYGDSRNTEILVGLDAGATLSKLSVPNPATQIAIDKGKGKAVDESEEQQPLWFENQTPIYPIPQTQVNGSSSGVNKELPDSIDQEEFALQQALLNEAQLNKVKGRPTIEPRALGGVRQLLLSTPSPQKTVIQSVHAPIRVRPAIVASDKPATAAFVVSDKPNTTAIPETIRTSPVKPATKQAPEVINNSDPTPSAIPAPIPPKLNVSALTPEHAPAATISSNMALARDALVQDLAKKVLTEPDQLKDYFAKLVEEAMSLALSRVNISAEASASAVPSACPPAADVVQPAQFTTVEAKTVNNPTPPRSPVQETASSPSQKSPQRAIRGQAEDAGTESKVAAETPQESKSSDALVVPKPGAKGHPNPDEALKLASYEDFWARAASISHRKY
ncbi:hypothetical protein QBC40DRAFT_265815 [Triangularia verruculosa]|uniref:Uncharacterized protein n=1 Tax=Triangularia verruculosa TaxID=2587418 RepID=A0AAN6XJH7_9PEZI|nr:hypothetical protein QBC40DRAFT_265815 [Triangularia verruculosa]